MARRHSDSARELAHDEESDDALDVAEHANRFAELLTRPGIPPDTAAALYEPPDPDNWTPPPRLPHDRELTISWIGRAHLGEQLEEAIRILGGQAMWVALSFLECIERSDTAPTASLAANIERHRIAIEVLGEAYERIDEQSSLALQTKGRAALIIAGNIVEKRLRTMEGMRLARARSADEIRSAATNTRGARGPRSGPERLRRFLRAMRPLFEARWSRKQLAELVIDAGGWAHPPCRNYVADLLEKHDRTGAIKALASRFTDAERRDAKRCK